MPYLYSVVHEATKTGLPIMRALWLHHPDDPKAVSCGDAYLWGRDILVAPVLEKGATTRALYLPKGTWFDFWTREQVEGGQQITRPVDLETLPLYVRAGAIIPMGPIKQYVGEPVDGPLELHVYPGADGSFLLYEDDGTSFAYRTGEWTGVAASWNDAAQSLSLHLSKGSKMRSPKVIEVHIGERVRTVKFDGHPVTLL
jgi:alpha-glucosidase/alpha-D-xyloside xylohydrolase